jgi:hypothetical protein
MGHLAEPSVCTDPDAILAVTGNRENDIICEAICLGVGMEAILAERDQPTTICADPEGASVVLIQAQNRIAGKTILRGEKRELPVLEPA